MKKIVRGIEAAVQVITAVLGVFAIIEGIKAWAYKRKMAKKAQEYLEDEFIPEANTGKTINVYSPTIKANRSRLRNLLAATGAGCIILLVINVLGLSRD